MAFERTWMRVMHRLIDRPLAVTAAEAARLVRFVGAQLNRDVMISAPELSEIMTFDSSDDEMAGRQIKPYRVDRGVAIIPVEGTLVHKLGSMQPYCGMTGYDGIEAMVEIATTDPDVRGILLDIDSPGGEAVGCFSVAVPAIRRARAVKPVWAQANGMAASAAYAIASQADWLVLSDTADVGSIGTVVMHIDHSQMLAKEGLTVTFIHAGAHKVDGHPFTPLPDAVRADIQAEVDTFNGHFLATVADGRAGVSIDQAAATEARMYLGEAAIAAGLADEILNPADVIPAFLGEMETTSATVTVSTPEPTNQHSSSKEVQMARRTLAEAYAAEMADKDDPELMDDDTDPDAGGDDKDPDLEDEDDKPKAEGEDKDPDGEKPKSEDDEEETDAKKSKSEGDEEEPKARTAHRGRSAADERKRIGQILNSSEAKGRGALANYLATETNLSARQARAALAKAAKESGGGLDARMAATPSASVPMGPDARGASGGAQANRSNSAASIVAEMDKHIG